MSASSPITDETVEKIIQVLDDRGYVKLVDMDQFNVISPDDIRAALKAAGLAKPPENRLHDAIVWAAEQDCQLTTDGSVGFGRDCVGVLHNAKYVETPGSAFYHWPEGLDGPDERLMPPKHVDEYHKGDYLCVLGHGDEAVEQLLDWIDKLRSHDAQIVIKERDLEHLPGSDHPLNWAIHGFSRAVIEFPGGYRR